MKFSPGVVPQWPLRDRACNAISSEVGTSQFNAVISLLRPGEAPWGRRHKAQHPLCARPDRLSSAVAAHCAAHFCADAAFAIPKGLPHGCRLDERQFGRRVCLRRSALSAQVGMSSTLLSKLTG
jgi:hypothetical protein